MKKVFINCKNCGKEINKNDKYCLYCGNFQSLELNKKKTSIIILTMFLIIVIIFIYNKINVNNNNENGIPKTLSDNINQNCNNSISYIKHDKISTYIWNTQIDIGECDGKFVKNMFNEKKGENKYSFSIEEYKINNNLKINNLFDEILYYELKKTDFVRVILPGSSV